MSRFLQGPLLVRPSSFILSKGISKVYSLQRKSHFCISRKETARPQSQFPHPCISVSGLHIPTIGPPIFLQQNRQTDLWEYINRSPKHECRNWERGRAVSCLGMFVSNFRYRVSLQCVLPPVFYFEQRYQ
jgi:hypothetical protein